jgi:hypothetical protein
LGDILFHIGIIIVKARVLLYKPGISILNAADLNVGELSGVSVVPSSLSAGVSPELSAMTSSLSELGGFSAYQKIFPWLPGKKGAASSFVSRFNMSGVKVSHN